MQVFKSFFKILKAQKAGIIIYTAIILVMLLVMGKAGTGNEDVFEQTGYTIIIDDEDDTEVSRGLKEYLLSIHEEKKGDFSEDQITDLLYYRSVLAHVVIPKGFEEDVKSGRNSGVQLRSDDSLPVASYLESQINAYTKHLYNYLSVGETFAEADSKAKNDSDYSRLVTMSQSKNANENRLDSVNVILFAAFSLMGIILSGLLPVLFKFKNKGVAERTAVSSYRPEKRVLELSLATVLFSFVVFLALAAMLYFLAGKKYDVADLGLYALNLFTFTVVTALIAIMIAQLPISGSTSQVGMITNVVSLSLSFLGGIFVPLSVLGEGVKSFGRFLPTYWYATAVEKIETGAAFSEIAVCLLIQLLFGAAFIVVGIICARMSENKSARPAKSEN